MASTRIGGLLAHIAMRHLLTLPMFALAPMFLIDGDENGMGIV